MDTNTSVPNEVATSIQITEDAISAAGQTLEDVVNPVKNIKWTTCKDFTVELGQQQIEEYISTWEFDDCWEYWCSFIDAQELEFSVRYHYRVCWSIPTSRKPIPGASASIYFFIDISKTKPKNLPVEVFYVLESNKYVHRPGKSRFREKWLKDIIESKIILLNSIKI